MGGGLDLAAGAASVAPVDLPGDLAGDRPGGVLVGLPSGTVPGGVYETLPSRLYTDPATFDAEQEVVFARSWQLVGHQSQVPNPGDHFLARVSGEAVVVVRGDDGTIRAFYNVCAHRGHELVTERRDDGLDVGTCRRFTCPYHAWSYRTDGSLAGAPNAAAFPGFDAATVNLAPVRVEVFHGLLLVNLAADAVPFHLVAGSASEQIARYAPGLADAHHVARTERRAAANWKVVAENFNECYHCAVVHKTLTTGVVDPDRYTTRVEPWGIVHRSPARPDDVKSYGYVADADAGTDWFLTWWFWPLFAVQVYPGGIVNTYRWRPVDVGTTEVEVDWWLPHPEPTEVEAEIIHQHRTTTFAEDGPIVDSVQRGLASRGFDRGPIVVDDRCSSRSEHPILGVRYHYLAAMGGAVSP